MNDALRSVLTWEAVEGGKGSAPREWLDAIVTLLGADDIVFLLPLFENAPGASAIMGDYGGDNFCLTNVTDYDNDPRLKGSVLAHDHNGSDERFIRADEDALSMGADGTAPNEPAFSVGMAVCLDDITSITLLGKYDATTAAEDREYHLYLDSNSYLCFDLFDESANANIGREYQVAISAQTWYIIIITYDSSCANTGIKIYLNGVQVDNANSAPGGSYVAMENGASDLFVGGRTATGGAYGNALHGRIALPFMTARELQAADVVEITNYYRRLLGI